MTAPTSTPPALASILSLTTAAAPKTLTAARELIDQIHAHAVKIQSAPSASPAAAAAITPAAVQQAAAAAGIAIPPARPTDAQLLATYATLTGGQRKAFLAQNSAALWRAHTAPARSRAHRG